MNSLASTRKLLRRYSQRTAQNVFNDRTSTRKADTYGPHFYFDAANSLKYVDPKTKSTIKMPQYSLGQEYG
jgi:hypothetical protein